MARARTDAAVFVENALHDVSFVARFFEALASNARAVKTVFDACLSLISTAGENVWFLSLSVLAILTTILVVSVVKLRKRSSHNASLFL